ncbi:MAG: hypothetical protein K0R76_1002 [Alphaproteobacteria bacterium]|jgi:hypothetical protein|nr:hypothetical protein [Alphaproteobacteria bacterium]
MVQGKVFQKGAFFLFIGSLNAAIAGPVQEWGAFDEVAPEGATPLQRGFGEEEIQAPEEDAPTELVEIATPKRRNGAKLSRKALAMVPPQSNRIIKEIKDETATTGINARKRLPPSLKHPEAASPFLHDIQAISNYLPALPQGKVD